MQISKANKLVSASILLSLYLLSTLAFVGCSSGKAPSGKKEIDKVSTAEKPSEGASIKWNGSGSGESASVSAGKSSEEDLASAKANEDLSGEDGRAYLNGAGLAELKCTLCHDSGRWKGLRQNKDWWNGKVDKMMRLGASKWITAEQAQEIVDYLAASSGPEAVETASNGEAKQVAGEAKPQAAAVAQETEVAGTAATTSTSGEATGTAAAASVPERQAYTGAELWLYLLGGGSMLAAGLKMRRR